MRSLPIFLVFCLVLGLAGGALSQSRPLPPLPPPQRPIPPQPPPRPFPEPQPNPLPGYGRPGAHPPWHAGEHRGGGFVDNRGHWHSHRGWRKGWRWDHGAVYPYWVHSRIVYPPVTLLAAPARYWQCTAFDSRLEGFSEIGPNIDEAAYGAFYSCGADRYVDYGCYVPSGYCVQR